MTTFCLTIPISEQDIRALHVGDTVYLSGVMTTGRDAAHKYLIETFIRADGVPESERPLYEELGRILRGGVIYHCGPVVRQVPPPPPPIGGGVGEGGDALFPPLLGGAGGGDGRWEFVAAGPTTSIREEPYQADVIAHFGMRGVIGKGGMGANTLRACREHGAVYFHAVGGAASLIANAVKEVVAVHKKDEFGVPEAFWVIRVERFPVVVTMDTHGQSIHDEVGAASKAELERLVFGEAGV